MILNDPDLVALIAGLHDAYERALAVNDVAALNAFFWNSPHVVRYGVAEQLYGADELHAYRHGHTPRFTERRLLRREIVVFGESCASVMSEIELIGEGRARQSRQSQTWICFPDLGWRVVAAHVSAPLVFPSAPPLASAGSDPGAAWASYVDAMAGVLELPLAAAHRSGVIANLARTAALAAPFLAFPLPDDAEPAPVFAP